MEFFGFIRIPQYIVQFMRGGSSGGISLEELYIMLGVAGGAYLICLILGGLALFNMAERAGLKHTWLGFIPFANTYYAGKVAGEFPFFGKKMKRAGLYAMLAEIVYVLFEIISLVSSILLSDPAYYETNFVENSSVLVLIEENVPAALLGLSNASIWISVIALVADLVMVIFFCATYNGLYRKYSPRNAYVMTVFSVILPLRAFIMFAVRAKEPVDYNEYIKKRLEYMMRGAGVPIESDTEKEENPFSDFANESADDSPFSEFDSPAETEKNADDTDGEE